MYFGTTLTNQNCIYEEIKSGLNEESLRSYGSAGLVFKSMKIKVHYSLRSYDFACRFAWTCNLFFHIKEGIFAEGAEEELWT